MENLTGTEIVIENVRYIVEKHETPEICRAENHPNIARMLTEQNAEILYLRRPAGTRFYQTKRSFHPKIQQYYYSKVTPIF